MARIGNRQHGALGEVERQNALFQERKERLNTSNNIKKAQQTRIKRNAQDVFSGIILTHIKHKNQ